MNILNKMHSSYKIKACNFLLKSYLGSGRSTIKSQEDIVVVFAANDAYIMLLSVAVKSLLLHYKHDNKLIIYIIDNGVSDQNKELFRESIGNKTEVKWIAITEQFLSERGLSESFSGLPTHYYRLLMPEFIPASVQRVLYLDCDIVVMRDIYDLWSMDFSGHVVLAVQDLGFPLIKDSILNYEKLNINPDAPYFNSGVLMINMDLWRRENISIRALHCVRTTDKNMFKDQYGLNVVLHKRWKKINPNWNVPSKLYPSRPYILHYAFYIKPTSNEYSYNYRERFFEVLDQTAWKKWRP